jgi:hypothetical protein
MLIALGVLLAAGLIFFWVRLGWQVYKPGQPWKTRLRLGLLFLLSGQIAGLIGWLILG